jgi:hypothetical protein
MRQEGEMMMKRARRVIRVLWRVMLALLLVAIAAWFALDRYSLHLVKKAEEDWAKAGLSMDSFEKAHPPVQANDSEREVERFAKELSARMERNSATKSCDGVADIEIEISDYYRAELSKEDSRVLPPSETLAAFLSQERAEAGRFRDFILTHDAPRIAFNLQDGASTEGVLQRFQLQCLLSCFALNSIASGDTTDGEKWMEAGWKTGRDLRESPYLGLQHFAMVMDEMWIGMLRKLDPAGPEWSTALLAYNPKRQVALALQLDYEKQLRLAKDSLALAAYIERGAYVGAVLNETLGMPRSQPGPILKLWRRLQIRLERPFDRWMIANSSNMFLEAVALIQTCSPCEFYGLGYEQALEKQVSVFNLCGLLAAGNEFSLDWDRANIVALHSEMTEKILELKCLRDENGGRWPENAPGIEACSCPDHL